MENNYDESQLIDLINAALTGQGRPAYTEDQLINVIDMIWDYYEENGMLEIDDDTDDDDTDIAADLCDYVGRMLKKDKDSGIDPADIATIVDTELQYEDSLLDL